MRARGSRQGRPSCGGPTRGGGLGDGLVHAGTEAAADGDVAGGVGLAPLVPQLLLSPPLGSSVGEPNLRERLHISFVGF